MTLYITLVGFFWALLIGLLAGTGRISQNVAVRNAATTYIEFIRGVPTIVLLFTLALVVVPAVFEFFGAENTISNTSRAIAALSIIYGAFLAEVFRAGIEVRTSRSSPSGAIFGHDPPANDAVYHSPSGDTECSTCLGE